MAKPCSKRKRDFLESVHEFAESTSFHGLRYISLNTSWYRRLMWLIFVLVCLVAVICQIIDRVGHYYDWPLNVNVEINYNQTLNFPAVTICNQNVFRATQTASLGRYRLVEKMYSNHGNISVDDLRSLSADNISLVDLYVDSAHTKEDLIKGCIWRNQPCSSYDFTRIMTDHGVCFQFYTNSDNMKVESSGVDSGLQLTLNVEQYEYMSGPHDAAGIKILMHDPRETPFVHELGQAVPTGAHAFIGIKYLKIENLEPPYGECGKKNLFHTDYYNAEECYLDCLTIHQINTCGCTGRAMPHINGSTVCSLEQYIGCLIELNSLFERSLRKYCTCPVPCNFDIFDASISYGSISNHIVNNILSSNDNQNLVMRLKDASEVTAKLDRESFSKFQGLTDTYIASYNQIKLLVVRMSRDLGDRLNQTEAVRRKMKRAYRRKERLYRFQEYAVEKNFIRAYDAMEERTFGNIVNAYAEFSLKLRNRILRLAKEENVSSDYRHSLFESIVDDIQARITITEWAQQNWTQLINAYVNGTPIFNYKFEKVRRSDNSIIVPKSLMNESMYYNKYMLENVYDLQEIDLNRLLSRLESFLNISIEAFENRTIDEYYLERTYYRFHFACRAYMDSQSKVHSMGLVRPLNILKERHSDFILNWTEFENHMDEIKQNLNALMAFVENITSAMFPYLDNVRHMLMEYTRTPNGTLSNIYSIFLSDDVIVLNSVLKTFIQEVQTRGQIVDDLVHLSYKPVMNMWTMILNDSDTVEYYHHRNYSSFLRNMTDVETEWMGDLSGQLLTDIRQTTTTKTNQYFMSFEKLAEHLLLFKSSLTVDGNFLKQNFLHIDIFYRQLSYEYVYQQKAYDFYALISDIGGALGLFVGASMMTILEVVDLFLIQIPFFKNKQTSSKKTPSDAPDSTFV